MSNQEPCPRIESLSALTDGELREIERSGLEEHVAGCAICAPVLAELRDLHRRFESLPSPAVDFDVAAALDRRIGAAMAPPPRRAAAPRARRRWWQVALLAPGGALALAVGAWLGAMMPATLASAGAPAAQMAAFSALPPGAVCPASKACDGAMR